MMNIPEIKYKFIGSKIKEARKEIEISQKELAKALGFESSTSISLIEAGERKVTVEDLEKIADFFHRDIKYFLGQEEQITDILVALRADKDLTEGDKKALLRFIELAKGRKNERRRNN